MRCTPLAMPTQPALVAFFKPAVWAQCQLHRALLLLLLGEGRLLLGLLKHLQRAVLLVAEVLPLLQAHRPAAVACPAHLPPCPAAEQQLMVVLLRQQMLGWAAWGAGC